MSKPLIIILNIVSLVAVVAFLMRSVIAGVGTATWSLSRAEGLTKDDIVFYTTLVLLIITIVCVILSHVFSNARASWFAAMPFILAIIAWIAGGAWIRINQRIYLQRQSEYSVQKAQQATDETFKAIDEILESPDENSR